MTTISSILINDSDDYIYPATLKTNENNPVRIRIMNLAEDTELYDSNDSNYPLETNISLGTEQKVILEVTLNKTDNITPVFEKATINYS